MIYFFLCVSARSEDETDSDASDTWERPPDSKKNRKARRVKAAGKLRTCKVSQPHQGGSREVGGPRGGSREWGVQGAVPER